MAIKKAKIEVMQSKRSIDMGNHSVKSFGNKNRGLVPHALVQLDEGAWAKVTGDGKKLPEKGYIKIERDTTDSAHQTAGQVWPGQPEMKLWDALYIAYGQAAVRQQVVPKRGAARYTWDYAGALAMGILTDTQEKGSHHMALRVSHAPQDYVYAKDLQASMSGLWTVTSYKGTMNFNIASVQTLDEPLAGAMYTILTKEGQVAKNNPFKGKTVLVIDIGSKTTDGAVIEPNGQIDITAMRSIDYGAQDALDSYWLAVQRLYASKLKNANRMSQTGVEKGLTTGMLPFASTVLPTPKEAAQNREKLAQNVAAFIEGPMGGALNYELIYLTGGGGAIGLESEKVEGRVYAGLRDILPDSDFLLAMKEDVDNIRYANVEGMDRFFAMKEAYSKVGIK